MFWHLADSFSASLFQIKPCQIFRKALHSSASGPMSPHMSPVVPSTLVALSKKHHSLNRG